MPRFVVTLYTAKDSETRDADLKIVHCEVVEAEGCVAARNAVWAWFDAKRPEVKGRVFVHAHEFRTSY